MIKKETFKFEDRKSERNFKAAIRAVKAGGRGCFFVTGYPGSGKSSLVRYILAPRFPEAAPLLWPRNQEELARTLALCLKQLGYVWFDDWRGPLNSAPLATFITSERWSYRPLFQDKIETLANDAVVFISGNELRISEDLLRRSKMIRLAKPTDEIEELLIKAASLVRKGTQVKDFSLAELMTIARRAGVIRTRDISEKVRLSKRLLRRRGMSFTDKNGRLFRFGHKRKKSGGVYPITFSDSKGGAR